MKLPNKKFTKKKSEEKSKSDPYWAKKDREYDAFLNRLKKAKVLDERDAEFIKKEVAKELKDRNAFDPTKVSYEKFKKILDKYDGKVRTIINRKGKLTKKIVKGDGKSKYIKEVNKHYSRERK